MPAVVDAAIATDVMESVHTCFQLRAQCSPSSRSSFPSRPWPDRPSRSTGHCRALPRRRSTSATRSSPARCVATVRVGEDGRVRDVQVTENTAEPGFESQLIKVLQSARFRPAIDASGKPVEASIDDESRVARFHRPPSRSRSPRSRTRSSRTRKRRASAKCAAPISSGNGI